MKNVINYIVYLRNCLCILLIATSQFTIAQKNIVQPNTQFRDTENNIYHIDSHVINVFVFLDTECPISQQYTTKLIELRSQLKPHNDSLKHNNNNNKDIQFYIVYPTKGIAKQEVEQFARKYNFNFPSIIDKLHYLTTLFNITITPEVIVIGAEGTVYYQGAIDNWFYSLGKHRNCATELYLKNALSALFAHTQINPQKTEAIGCYIER